ncbi:site-2 protease family protein [Alloyangia pacifica]|uniref:Zinc metalloprotease n=1 Tax=Alloyangia pacifica TaxID=311180 RepID=A0A1I6PF07_9RHOB|nr:site-2 protease family protein [Alloyangia pacifica]SDG26217.1 stage IV sporulation protein FB [Alloyangia pacifica]SFS38766.1 stage IV sporulation protein FB [Alloyangia pacifica]
MHWSFPIGRLFGSELRVHATFFLLLLWIGVAAWSAGGMAAAVQNVLFVLALFACVVAHEFGHALTARRFGIKTPDITLLPIGGLARLERMPEKPEQEIAVAIAGPLVNVAIWLVLVLLGATSDMGALARLGAGTGAFLSQLASINLALALFNMIPAFPMDGGRVLRAVLALRTDRVRATRAAAVTGQVLAFGLAFWGLSSGNFILILIAIFVFFAGQAESQDVASRAVAHDLLARDAMITSFESLRPEDLLSTAGQTLIRTTQHEFPVLAPGGQLAGFLTRDALFRGMAEGAATRRVEEVMTEVPQLPLAAPLQSVLDALAEAPAVAVIDAQSRVLGYVTRENVGELMVLRGPSMAG